jgi:DNA-binding LacI/PurR family transcriptional regulator
MSKGAIDDELEPELGGAGWSRVTARDVARILGISTATVSRAFTENAVIAPETRDRVLETAVRIGYQPNPFARSLTTRRSKIAGIVVADITNPFYPEVLAALTRRLQEAGLQTMLFFAGPGRNVDDSLPALLQYSPDIAIVLAATLSSDMVRACRQAGTPVLLFNRYVPNSHAAAVSCDNHAGGRLVAETFLAAGHKRLAYVAGLPDTSTNRDRLAGYREVCRERDMPEPVVSEGGSFTYKAGYDGLKRLFDRVEPPDAVFCANDIVAVGALDAARRELGIRVPEQLSIIGFDDIAMAAWPSYALTTVRQPINAMIDATISQTKRLLADRDAAPETRILPGRLVRRSSARLEMPA